MQEIKCSWKKTQDSFTIETPYVEFSTWFVCQCHDLGNDFILSDFINDKQGTFIDALVEELKTSIVLVNEFLCKIKEPIIPVPEDIEHQTSLNQLHKDWIRVHRNKPGIDTLIYKIDPGLFDKFHDINRLVHVIEGSFAYTLRSRNLWRVNNPFSVFDDWNEYNVSIGYNDFGKNSFEKWHTRDTTPNDQELSQWNNIGGALRFVLNKSRSNTMPSGYFDYCNQHNIKAVVPFWPLGNIVNLDQDLGKLRRMFNHNLQIVDNDLKLDLI